jgi:acetyl-CoA C-acetyltransferase
MARVLRDDPGSLGLVTAISGMITKQGVSMWSTNPPSSGFRSIDVTADAAEATPEVAVVDAPAGGVARIAAYTVLFDGDDPSRAVVLADLPDGSRAIAASDDAALARSMTESEWCGRDIGLDGGGAFSAR